MGGRLGFAVKGCNYPGHFLAKVEMDEELIFIDCFNGGKIFYENDLRNLLDDKNEDIIEHVKADVSAETIIIRILNNLVNSYIFLNDHANTEFFKNLISLTTNKNRE